MTNRAGRRCRHRRHKRSARIGPEFGTGLRRKRFETMTELSMLYDERDHDPRFQRWHFAKWHFWPSSVLRALRLKMDGRPGLWDALLWNTIGQADHARQDGGDHAIIDPFLVALFDVMARQADGLSLRYDGGKGAMEAAVEGIRQAVRQANIQGEP